MALVIQSLRKEAEKKFLGLGPVVGIGIAPEGEHFELVFLLRKESAEARDSVLTWANERHVRVQFIITGRITSLEKV
jgi:hypothetical protein